MWFKKVWIVVFIIFLFFIGSQIKDSISEPTFKNGLPPIKIGLVGPFTGIFKDNGISMLEGAELAVENINKGGGINGREVVLVVKDDQGNPSECIKVVTEMIFEEQVYAIIGPFNSPCCVAVKDTVNKNKTPLITPAAMADEINTENDFVFRNTLGFTEINNKINNFVNIDAGEYARLEGIGCETMGIIWQNDSWGEAWSIYLEDTLKSFGKLDALYFNEPYDLDEENFIPLLQKVLKREPDLIFACTLTQQAVNIVKQSREYGYKGLFMGLGGFNSQVFDEELGILADGCIFGTQWHPSFSTPMSDVFMQLYQNKYHHRIPDMFTAITYEAAYIVRDAIIKAGPNYDDIVKVRLQIRDNLAVIKNFNGISGFISFDSVGQCDRPEFWLQKRWDGNKITAVIIYPKIYAQSNVRLPSTW